ncbi:hypothetical protein GCM10007242_44660 [Pigmentiphaga litoralis]|uniref:head-tail connector protein n=1 Tax=Pigmentiphaga litoralis TaxID=516702 RepID=UPI0016754750|nr:head-tail connector protein [Pigmentiphaga litoralis]GGX32774.1 hypothetical protein GCM10007242_44660 [Pigmentiphaga litoralis]
MALVSVELARASQRIEIGEQDALVEFYLGAAEQVALDYLNRKVYSNLDELQAAVLAGDAGENPILVNGAIQAGILLIFGQLHSHRENVVVGVTAAELPQGARSLLRPNRIRPGV